MPSVKELRMTWKDLDGILVAIWHESRRHSRASGRERLLHRRSAPSSDGRQSGNL